MKINMFTKKGFTLIELLVVVFIIGILAAIAVPQYQLAVMKSRVAQVVSAVSSIAQAQEFYYLANGHYTNNIADLDINVKLPDDWEFKFYNDDDFRKVEAWYKGLNNELQLVHYYKNPGTTRSYIGFTTCWAYPTNDMAVKTCKSLGKGEGSSNRWVL